MKKAEEWIHNPDIRPYVFVRPRNRPAHPGQIHPFKFPGAILYRDPEQMDEAQFAYQILRLENKCFEKTGLVLPRWALYDCAVMPGFVGGFAIRQTALPHEIRSILTVDEDLDWVPISLFICIPTAEQDHWVANNLCSINSLVPDDLTYPALGFITKAFGLWYSNIKYLYGMTQWGNISLKVHSNYGSFELMTAYSPIHSIAATLTYRVEVDSQYWDRFLNSRLKDDTSLEPTSILLNAKDEQQLIELQRRIEDGQGPFFLNGCEISKNGVNELRVYRRIFGGTGR